MTKKQHRGFKAMSEDLQRKIARKGGKAVFRKYGFEYMRDIGRVGGLNSHK